MLSKLLTASVGLASADLVADRVYYHHSHPQVKAIDTAYCTKSIDRLMIQPKSIDTLNTASTTSGTRWVDTSFTGSDIIYYPEFQSASIITDYETNFADGSYFWDDWQDIYTAADVFDSTRAAPTWKEPRQGGAGTCYLMSALSGVAEFPDIIKSMFVTQASNTSGAFRVKFYIRGKPWVFNIDSQFLVKKDFNNALNLHNALKYALINTYETDNTTMWAPLLEKAWAKIKGNYEIANGGFIGTGLNTLTGAPVFSYKMSTIGSDSGDTMTLDAAYTMIQNADTKKYIMGAGTTGGDDTTANACGIANGHAYSIIAAFTLTSTTHGTIDFLMFRNPWGNTNYNYNWGPADTRWTDDNNELKDKMMALTDDDGTDISFDPTAAQSDDTVDGVFGVFVMDKATWGE